tara:strand:+ start:209 stop:1405 length:1197 start_codon:yes stop_codon:yes gene_type:complete
MSIFYKESNEEGTRDLFDKSVIYRGEMIQYSQTYSNVVDFNFGEKYLYGRVNRNYVTIQPNEIMASFSNINNASNRNSIRVLNFVAEGFQELSRQFKKAAQIGKIDRNDDYLTNLIAYDGYRSPENLYNSYISDIVLAIRSKVDEDKIIIRSFDDFINHLIGYITALGPSHPITKTGFIRSRHCSPLVSGLTIEIADLTYTNDRQKIDLFKNSRNFEYYLNACNSFGFMVDASIPWRITLDIGHEDVVENLLKPQGFSSTESLLLIGFKQTHISYYNLFKNQLLQMYNQIVKTKHIEYDSCSGKTKIINRTEYTLDNINNIYNEDYFIKLYCMFRFIEEENKHSKAEQDHNITDFINLSRTSGVNYAIGSFERFISQPFDYRGSLSYLIREQEKREDV